MEHEKDLKTAGNDVGNRVPYRLHPIYSNNLKTKDNLLMKSIKNVINS